MKRTHKWRWDANIGLLRFGHARTTSWPKLNDIRSKLRNERWLLCLVVYIFQFADTHTHNHTHNGNKPSIFGIYLPDHTNSSPLYMLFGRIQLHTDFSLGPKISMWFWVVCAALICPAASLIIWPQSSSSKAMQLFTYAQYRPDMCAYTERAKWARNHAVFIARISIILLLLLSFCVVRRFFPSLSFRCCCFFCLEIFHFAVAICIFYSHWSMATVTLQCSSGFFFIFQWNSREIMCLNDVYCMHTLKERCGIRSGGGR